MSKEFQSRRLDVPAFAEEGARLAGEQPQSAFERLQAETEGRGAERPVTWSARGELRNPRHVQPEAWLHLTVQASVSLTCQHCLAPVDTPVDIERSFRFVADEDTAEREDDESEEDLLVTSRQFDLLQLVEDEILMDLPLVPQHEVCPESLPRVAEDPGFEAESTRPNPFAVLAGLKGGSGGKG